MTVSRTASVRLGSRVVGLDFGRATDILVVEDVFGGGGGGPCFALETGSTKGSGEGRKRECGCRFRTAAISGDLSHAKIIESD